jgi:NhaP-type Na+/H+ or K+/H+ antiporter
MTVRTRAIVSAIIGLVVGAAYPFIDIAVRCHAPASESCVWGNAYFMLTVAVSVPLIGAVAAAVAYACLGWIARRERDKAPTDPVS